MIFTLSATAKYVDVAINNLPKGTSAPTAGNFSIKIDNVSTRVKASYFDDDTGSMRLWYNEVTMRGTHIVEVDVSGYAPLSTVTNPINTTFEV